VEDTPVGRFLTKTTELGLLHRRAIATRIRFALAAKGLRIADGFAAMDRDKYVCQPFPPCPVLYRRIRTCD
jgi:hypothetical protein